MIVDLLVAGGGPAGLAAAIAGAQAGAKVMVLEPRVAPIDKACGEGVMAGGVRALRELGVVCAGMPIAGIRYCDANDEELVAHGDFGSAPAVGIRRTVLHAALSERAASLGVRIQRARVHAIEELPGAVRIGEHTARWLIGADGLHSQVRRLHELELPARHRPRIGVRRHFEIAPWSDRVEVHFGHFAEAYVTPVAEDTIGVAFLFEKEEEGSPPSWDELLLRFPLLQARLANARIVSSLRGAGPFEQRVRQRVVGQTLLVGDAAGYVDPLTGEGVALGIESARLAVECIARGEEAAYERAWQALTRRPLLATEVLLSIARRDRLHRPLLRAARALPRVFDAALSVLSTTKSPLLASA